MQGPQQPSVQPQAGSGDGVSIRKRSKLVPRRTLYLATLLRANTAAAKPLPAGALGAPAGGGPGAGADASAQAPQLTGAKKQKEMLSRMRAAEEQVGSGWEPSRIRVGSPGGSQVRSHYGKQLARII